MKPIIPQFQYNSGSPLYIQLYSFLKDGIKSGDYCKGEKLPSLRLLAQTLGISVTTIEQAYSQLLVEGYIISKPQSGYYISDIAPDFSGSSHVVEPLASAEILSDSDYPFDYDLSCFDFNKWKKCASRVLTDYPEQLLYESNPQGEESLRLEIAKYLRTFRGVNTTAEQIVISAGTQQTTSYLSKILKQMNIFNVSMETPGYLPVQRIFHDEGFSLGHIPVEEDGLAISLLPTNISSAVYVSPSNQFPTGSIMPVGKRYRLIEWAKKNSSYIIEDDYDSELRYFGKPVPALQGLDTNERVIYLGSFSSTLFPAIKISYMVLPHELAEIFHGMMTQYSQTCSKTEQLTLALFMKEGHYNTGIKKLRKSYSQKLQTAITSFGKYSKGMVTPTNTSSGINMILKVRSKKSVVQLCDQAKSLGIQVLPVRELSDQDTASLAFYYNQLRLENMDEKIRKLLTLWLS